MQQDEIIKRRDEINEQIDDAREALDIAIARKKALQRRCKHPNVRKVSSMGEIGEFCPDCEYQT